LWVEQFGGAVLALDRDLDPAGPGEIRPGPAAAAGQGVAFDPQLHSTSVDEVGKGAPYAATKLSAAVVGGPGKRFDGCAKTWHSGAP
jgi:hypothetical protein